MLNKLEKYLFYILIFSVPFQTRKILFYSAWRFSEWKAISVYFTDILFFTLFCIWIFQIIKEKRTDFKFSHADYALFGFILVSAISLKNALNLQIGLFQILKLIEFAIFYFYLKFYALKKFELKNLFAVLILGGVFQAVIGIIQYLKQSDLGLRFLGETFLLPGLQNVAVFYNSFGEKIMRVYGTTPHPNILAAYLFLSIFAFYFLFLYSKGTSRKINQLLLAAYGLILLALLFTFSRTIIFIWALGFAVRAGLIYFKKDFREKFWSGEYKKKLISILVLTALILAVFAIVFWPEVITRIKISGDEEAVSMRVFYAKESLGMHLNFFGVGIGNFVNWLETRIPNLPADLYQPVHNIYLLVYNETGLLGIIFFIAFLLLLAKDFILKTKMKNLYHYSFFLIFLSVLFMGFFDHFFWTLQQGRFIFWAVLAFIAWASLPGEN